MQRSPYWLILLLAIGSVVLWFSGDALYKIYRYRSLNGVAKPLEISWSVHAFGDEDYAIEAKYRFQVKGKDYSGEEEIKPRLRNPWAAKDQAKFYQAQEWQVFYSEYQPQYSTLQKSFPLKESISALILWILFAYFIWLGYYMMHYKT